jgi:hypothetical protein
LRSPSAAGPSLNKDSPRSSDANDYEVREATVLDLICYLIAVVIWGLAAIAPNATPALDRVRMVAVGLVAFGIPFVIHAGQHLS